MFAARVSVYPNDGGPITGKLKVFSMNFRVLEKFVLRVRNVAAFRVR